MLTSAPSSARIGRQDAAAAKGCAAVQRAFVVAALSSFPCPHTPPLRRSTPDPPPAAAAAATTNRTQINLVIFFVLVLQIKLQK